MAALSKPIPPLYTVYILRSTVRRATLYIGSTPHPPRRLKQHNGIAKGGAARTSRNALRPWEMVGLVSGFPGMVAALKFEYAGSWRLYALGHRDAIADCLQMGFDEPTPFSTHSFELQDYDCDREEAKRAPETTQTQSHFDTFQRAFITTSSELCEVAFENSLLCAGCIPSLDEMEQDGERVPTRHDKYRDGLCPGCRVDCSISC